MRQHHAPVQRLLRGEQHALGVGPLLGLAAREGVQAAAVRVRRAADVEWVDHARVDEGAQGRLGRTLVHLHVQLFQKVADVAVACPLDEEPEAPQRLIPDALVAVAQAVLDDPNALLDQEVVQLDLLREHDEDHLTDRGLLVPHALQDVLDPRVRGRDHRHVALPHVRAPLQVEVLDHPFRVLTVRKVRVLLVASVQEPAHGFRCSLTNLLLAVAQPVAQGVLNAGEGVHVQLRVLAHAVEDQVQELAGAVAHGPLGDLGHFADPFEQRDLEKLGLLGVLGVGRI